MSDRTLADLVKLNQARFQAEQAKLRDITMAEARLRKAVADLEEHHRAAQDLQRADIQGHRSIGGDVLWQGWVGRSRRSLQIHLAQVLVQKGQKLQALQRAHGRKLASETLLDDASATQRKQSEKIKIEQEQRLILLNEARRRGLPD